MSCAWPDPEVGHRHTAEFCENGAKAVAEEATTGPRHPGVLRRAQHRRPGPALRVLARPAGPDHPSDGQAAGRDATTQPIDWDDGVRADRRRAATALASPDEAIFYTSGRASNEAAFAYQLFVRAFGTNNLPDCSNMCHESTSVALAESIGIGKASVSIEDVYNAKLIIVAGQNPGTNHPRMLSALEIAKRNGAKIISINPLREAGLVRVQEPADGRTASSGTGTELADLHLPIKINGDLALFQAIGSLLVQWDALDHDFIDRHTTGFEAVARHVSGVDWDAGHRGHRPDPRADHRGRADAPRRPTATVFCWAMGLTQHRNAVATIKEVSNLAFAQGNIGKPGAGLFPVRGHSNVQGDRTMGIWERPPAHFLDALQKEFGFDPPREHGLDTVDSIRALRDGKAHFFIGLGGNFVQAAPDTEVVDRGDAPGPADRAHLDQAEPLAPGLRRDRADPADQGPHREGHPGQRPAVDLGGGLDLLGARLPRAAGAGQPAPEVRGGDRQPDRRGHPRGPVRHRLAGHAGRLQRHPRSTSPGWCPAASATR